MADGGGREIGAARVGRGAGVSACFLLWVQGNVATVSPVDPLLTRKEARYRLGGMSRTTFWRRVKWGQGLRFLPSGMIRESVLRSWAERNGERWRD